MRRGYLELSLIGYSTRWTWHCVQYVRVRVRIKNGGVLIEVLVEGASSSIIVPSSLLQLCMEDGG